MICPALEETSTVSVFMFQSITHSLWLALSTVALLELYEILLVC